MRLRHGWGVVDEVWLKSGRGLASVTILAKAVLAQALESITKTLVGPTGTLRSHGIPSETPAKTQ